MNNYCSHPRDHFCKQSFEKYRGSNEVRLVFDGLVISIIVYSSMRKVKVSALINRSSNNQRVIFRYDVQSSLKTATQVIRQGGEAPIFKITKLTQIAKEPVKRLLSR